MKIITILSSYKKILMVLIPCMAVTQLIAQTISENQGWESKINNDVIKKENSGNVGIGTNVPEEKLHVAGNMQIDSLSSDTYRVVIASPSGKLMLGAPAQTSSSSLFPGSGSDTKGKGGFTEIIPNGGNTNITANPFSCNGLWTRSGDNLYNCPLNGKVGIGTYNVNIDNRLQVVGTMGISTPTTNNFIDDAMHAQIEQDGSSLLLSQNLYQGNGGWNKFKSGYGSSQIRLSLGNISFFTGSEQASAPGTERMKITNNGNVGIGTSSPSSKFHVRGIFTLESSGTGVDPTLLFHYKNTSATYDDPSFSKWGIAVTKSVNNQLYFFNEITNKKAMTLNENGNIGINTDNPGAFLEVNSGEANASPIVAISTPNAENFVSIFGGRSGNPNPFIVWRNGPLRFGTATSFDGSSYVEKMRITNDGKVGIGTVNMPGSYKLYVKGGILTEKVRSAVEGDADWSDYVFYDDYKLMSLSTLEKYIKKHKHLPEVPSAKEVVANGVDMVEMDAVLLKKIEELSLYVIAQQKLLDAQQKQIENLKNEMKIFKN